MDRDITKQKILEAMEAGIIDRHQVFITLGNHPVGNSGSPEWSEFLDIWGEAYHERMEKIFPVNQFIKDLEELVKKYPQVSISSGCGCCGAGIHFSNETDNYERGFLLPELEKI